MTKIRELLKMSKVSSAVLFFHQMGDTDREAERLLAELVVKLLEKKQLEHSINSNSLVKSLTVFQSFKTSVLCVRGSRTLIGHML